MAIDSGFDVASDNSSRPWWEALAGTSNLIDNDVLRSPLTHSGEYGVSKWYESSESDVGSGTKMDIPNTRFPASPETEYSPSRISPIKSAETLEELSYDARYSPKRDDDVITIAPSYHFSTYSISQEFNETTADTLYTPMTGTSSVYSRPEELPPGVVDTIDDYKQGQWSTVKVYLEYLPSPLFVALKKPGPDVQRTEMTEEACEDEIICENEREMEIDSGRNARRWFAGMSSGSEATLSSPLSPPKTVREHRVDSPEARSMAASLHCPSSEKLPMMLEKPLPDLPIWEHVVREGPQPRSQTASCPPPISIPPRVPLRNPYRLSPKSQATKSLHTEPARPQLNQKRSAQALVLAPKLPPISRQPNLEPLEAIGVHPAYRSQQQSVATEEMTRLSQSATSSRRQAPPPISKSLAHQPQSSITSATSFYSASSPAPPPSVYLCSSGSASQVLGYSPPSMQSAPIPFRSMSFDPNLQPSYPHGSPEFENAWAKYMRKKYCGEQSPLHEEWPGNENFVNTTTSSQIYHSLLRSSDFNIAVPTLNEKAVRSRATPPNMVRQRTFPTKSASYVSLRKNGTFISKEALPELPRQIVTSSSTSFSPNSSGHTGMTSTTPSSAYSTDATTIESSNVTSPSDDLFIPNTIPRMGLHKRTSSLLTIGSHDTNLSEGDGIAIENASTDLQGQSKASDASVAGDSAGKPKELGFLKKLALKHRASKDSVGASSFFALPGVRLKPMVLL